MFDEHLCLIVSVFPSLRVSFFGYSSSEEPLSNIISRLKVQKVTVSRSLDGHFLSLSSGVGEGDPGLTVEDSLEAIHEIGHLLDRSILERIFLAQNGNLPVNTLVEAQKGLKELYGRFKTKKFGS